MGRVDEALKRAVLLKKGARDLPQDRLDTVFVSPWNFEVAEPGKEPSTREATVPTRASVMRREAVSRTLPRLQLESQLAMAWPQPFGVELAGKLVIQSGTDPEAVEQYANAARALNEAQAERDVKAVYVAGASTGDGATLTAINLAFTLSRSDGRRVLLVDANLHAPRIHRLFQVSPKPGFGEWLEAGVGSKLPAIELTERLAVLPGGAVETEPDILGSDRLREALKVMSQSFDWVVLDGPAATTDSGADQLASVVDIVLLVIQAQKTPRDVVTKAVDILGRDRVIGVVLNRAGTGV